MKLEVTRYGLRIIPENAQDEAFIEEVLKINGADAGCVLVRRNVVGTGKLAFIETMRS